MKVEEWTDGHVNEVAGWRYDPPYDFYDLASDPADEAAMRDPARTEHCRAVLGESFMRAQLDYALQSWQPETFRLFVAAWNERAIRLYTRLGFHEVGRETRSFELVGKHEFVQMERAA